MKKRLLALALCCVLLCSGCTAMLERNYSSSAAHVDYSGTEDSSILRAESYQALVNSLLYFVGEHIGGGIIRLYNYTGNVEADLARACAEVTEEDPLGSFAVRSIDYESTRILTYYEVKFRILYQRTAVEVAEIRAVSGQTGIRQELTRITDNHLPHSTMRTAYFSGDSSLVSHLFWLSFYGSPASAVEAPEFSAAFYPESGTQRILDLEIKWPLSSNELEAYEHSLHEAAAALIPTDHPEDTPYTVQELASLLRNMVAYDPSGSHTALDALTGIPVNDLGVLLALEYLCQQEDIEVSVVSDSTGTQMWLIVATPSGYRHLLPRDLRPGITEQAQPDPEPTEEPAEEPTEAETSSDSDAPPAEEPAETPAEEPAPLWLLPLYTDEELSALGFEWPRDLHPACVDYSGSRPE